jgi:cytochrome c oxidase subunit 4
MSEHHVVPVRNYIVVFAALMVLTVITVAVAFVDLGVLNDIVMLAIAVTKAVLVILIFMHVRYATRLTALTVAGGFVWLGILLVLTLQDYLSRGAFGILGK